MKPFYCGTQFADWHEHNCVTCAKGSEDEAPPEPETMPCDIERELFLSGLLGDGTISDACSQLQAKMKEATHVDP